MVNLWGVLILIKFWYFESLLNICILSLLDGFQITTGSIGKKGEQMNFCHIYSYLEDRRWICVLHSCIHSTNKYHWTHTMYQALFGTGCHSSKQVGKIPASWSLRSSRRRQTQLVNKLHTRSESDMYDMKGKEADLRNNEGIILFYFLFLFKLN